MHAKIMESTKDIKLQLSVVLSTYNRADTLAKTLDYLTRKELAPSMFEVVVVDDGFPDHTRKTV